MTDEKKKYSVGLTEIIMAVLALLYTIGIRAWFPVCAAMSDSVMACHWAGQTLKAISILLLALAVVHIIIRDENMKLGMDISLLGTGLITMLIPGHIINICRSAEMACRGATLPWTIAFGIVWILVILADILFFRARLTKQRHQRPQRSDR